MGSMEMAVVTPAGLMPRKIGKPAAFRLRQTAPASMAGLDELVHALKCPDTLFGPPSPRQARAAPPTDWDALPAQIARSLKGHGRTCASALRELVLAAELLRAWEVRLCAGPARIQCFEDEWPPSLYVVLELDLDPDQAYELLRAHDRLSVQEAITIGGFCLDLTGVYPDSEGSRCCRPQGATR